MTRRTDRMHTKQLFFKVIETKRIILRCISHVKKQ